MPDSAAVFLCEMACDIRQICILCRKRSAIEPAACDLNLRNRPVFCNLHSICAALSGKSSAVGLAMPENIYFPVNFHKSAMVIACIIHSKLIALITQIAV